MFKAFGNFLYRTPWWALILLGATMLTSLVLFSMPFNVISLQKDGGSPEQKRAIQHEIASTFGHSLLGVAEDVVKAINENSTDPVRKAELARAIQEIARARNKIESGQADLNSARREAMQEAAEAAIEAAQDAYDDAVEAREKVEEDQQEVRSSLKNGKIPPEEWPKSLDEALNAARKVEKDARDVLDASRSRLQEKMAAIEIAISSGQALPEKTDGSKGSPGQDRSASAASPEPGLPALAPELRQDIRSRVANDFYRAGVGSLLILAFIPLFVMVLISKVFIGRARRSQDLAESTRKEAEQHNFNRQLTEARLQALQAQVEPHFLYNTLANVQALTEVDPPAANKMVGHLIQYLRASLPRMREAVSTVAQEVELTEAYLNILKMRMGDRLAFSINISDAAKSISFPPLMLPSLVENAVKHGLEPQREGGRIDIVATVEGDKLSLRVEDSGRGFSKTGETVGGGVGLPNIRERLAALYGDAAKLTLEANPDKGVVARILMPATTAASNAQAAGGARSATPPPAAGKAAQSMPQEVAAKVWSAVARTHTVWGRVISSTFVILMIALAVVFGIALAALLTGVLPANINNLEINGIEGMALGSLGLLAGFSAAALALMVVVAVVYGLGLLAVGLMIFIPVVVAISIFPSVAPFVLLGLLIYWYVRKRNKTVGGEPGQ